MKKMEMSLKLIEPDQALSVPNVNFRRKGRTPSRMDHNLTFCMSFDTLQAVWRAVHARNISLDRWLEDAVNAKLIAEAAIREEREGAA